MLRVFDYTFNQDKIILETGEYHVSDGNCILCTVLGSCVAVCLRDQINGISGMNHFMLPEPLSQKDLFSEDAGRYGIYALELLINNMLRRGVSRGQINAKIFGGAHLLATSEETVRIPNSNVELARKYLLSEKIPVTASDTGGRLGRKILFFSSNGDVLVKKLSASALRYVIASEGTYQKQFVSSAQRDDGRLSYLPTNESSVTLRVPSKSTTKRSTKPSVRAVTVTSSRPISETAITLRVPEPAVARPSSKPRVPAIVANKSSDYRSESRSLGRQGGSTLRNNSIPIENTGVRARDTLPIKKKHV